MAPTNAPPAHLPAVTALGVMVTSVFTGFSAVFSTVPVGVEHTAAVLGLMLNDAIVALRALGFVVLNACFDKCGCEALR